MKGRQRIIGAFLASYALVACGGTTYSDHVYNLTVDAGSPSDQDPWLQDAGPSLPAAKLTCREPKAADHLPARAAVMTRPKTTIVAGMSVDDLFQSFSSQCQGCHVDQALGGFHVTRKTFSDVVDEITLARIRSDDPKVVMPPPPVGRPFKERPAGDPVVEFSALLETWIKAGRPADVFYPDANGGSAGDAYFLPESIGKNLTNLGNCIPSAQGFAREIDRSKAIDAMFEKATELPERLDQTDLFTLDAKELARHGVVAFAPAYTLWADNAKKMRMVRVPRGTSIKFDKTTQSFSIPPNTRFYKTFFKHVKDRQGNETYRKMETRIIVARPDDETKTDGLERHTALFGTYAWNEQETEAVLVRDPLRDGKPWRDRLITYYLDEQRVEELIEAGEPNLEHKLEDENLSRKYAMPGSERCIHCHMGSVNKNFVLGFIPLQIHRRKVGEGGTVDMAAEDELNQLQRFIDYGLISGMKSPDDVTLLENSQGKRTPRNDHELTAQGYMLGNCAHCHNPRGFPSSVASELRDVLDFQPSDAGGIFRFPLDKFSPRISRGVNQDIKIPYITPSLYDLPSGYASDSGGKIVSCSGGTDRRPQYAPWRSLIYRNVDSPFSYSDDFTIFPHMPRDTPGFDCRAQQLLGTWMVSIPARWKGVDSRRIDDPDTVLNDLSYPEAAYKPDNPDDMAQPYVEVLPADPEYKTISLQTDERIAQFQKNGRYTMCPDPTLDIIDPEIGRSERHVPEPESTSQGEGTCLIGGGVVPERPHWFIEDLTEANTAWGPRRSDWATLLQKGQIPEHAATTAEQLRNANDRRTVRILTGKDPWQRQDRASDVRIGAAFKKFALSEFPLGLWQKKSTCDFSKIPKVSDYAATDRPHWFDVSGDKFGPVASDAAVYTITPGGQVFTSICSNCHGPLADSRGRMAGLVADLTGGDTRVANLRDGFFGPVTMPGDNRKMVFGAGLAASSELTADDWGARYLLWMGLGGTQRLIPAAVLTVVANTQVLGIRRQGLYGLGDVGANMLAVAEFLCDKTLPYWARAPELRFNVATGDVDDWERYPNRGREAPSPEEKHPWRLDPPIGLISTNGDAELWQRLCSFDNPAPVRVVAFDEGLFRIPKSEQFPRDDDGQVKMDPTTGEPVNYTVPYPMLIRRELYPADARVGDLRGHIQSKLAADNIAPWCVQRPAAGEEAALLAAYRAARPGDSTDPPYCPDGLTGELSWFNDAQARDWTRRGAMNAGLSVFMYVDALTKGQITRKTDFNRCEDLP